MMSKYTLEVALDDDVSCMGCPCLHDYSWCRVAYLTGRKRGEWDIYNTKRPEWCPLKEEEE